jgi:hypothetical protein
MTQAAGHVEAEGEGVESEWLAMTQRLMRHEPVADNPSGLLAGPSNRSLLAQLAAVSAVKPLQ